MSAVKHTGLLALGLLGHERRSQISQAAGVSRGSD